MPSFPVLLPCLSSTILSLCSFTLLLLPFLLSVVSPIQVGYLRRRAISCPMGSGLKPQPPVILLNLVC